MKDLLERMKQWTAQKETKRLLQFFIIPLAAVLLIAVVMTADKSGNDTDKTGKLSEETVTAEASDSSEDNIESEPITAAAEPADDSSAILSEEAIPEIHDLLEKYFTARQRCDGEALSEVYGGTASAEAVQSAVETFREDVKYYQHFDNLVCYTKPGLSEGEYVVYARFDIKFCQADTPAPSLMVCYAKTAPDGSFYLEAVPSNKEAEQMEKASESSQVQEMAESVKKKMEEALNADENLLAVYRILTE